MSQNRQDLLNEIDYFMSLRNLPLEAIRLATMQQEEYENLSLLKFILRMVDAELARCRKALDYRDGKLSGQEFMEWYTSHLAVKQLRMTGLRSIMEGIHDNGYFETSEQRQLFEKYFQEVKDSLLQETHHREQIDAAMEVDAMYPSAKPDHNGPVERFCGFPIRCSEMPGVGSALDANNTLAVLRIVNGEIDNMAQQPRLNAEQAVREMERIVSLYQDTPETKHFREWVMGNICDKTSP